MSELKEKKCVPCEGGIPPLPDDDINKYESQAPGWEVFEESGMKKMKRDFEFKDFKEAMEFINKLAGIAEEQGHHPDILLHAWNKVRIIFYTHAIGGLHENDFIMAAKTNDLV